VSGNPPNGLPSVSTPDSVTVDSIATPDLAFEKRALNTDFTTVGDILNFEFDVTNTGGVTLSNIAVTDDLVTSVSCPRTSLAPADVNTASLDAVLPNGNAVPTLTDSVTVTGTPSPQLTISKSALTASYTAVGDTIDYEIVIGNIGNVTISDIVL